MNLKAVIMGLGIVLVIWVAYVAYAAYTASPEISARWGHVDEKKTEIIVEAKLGKPLLVPAAIEDMTIEFMGIRIAEVEGFNYSATGRYVSMVLAIDNSNLIRSLVRYLDNGQTGTVLITLRGKLLGIIPVNADIQEGISENVLAYMNFTAESREIAGSLVKTPALVETTFDWAGEKNGKAVLVAHMKFYNPNGFPIPVGNVSFDTYANDILIGYGKTTKRVVIPARGYATIDVRTYITEDSLPKAWAIHVRNGEISKVRADIFLNVGFMGQSYRVKLVSYEETIKTNIMDTINSMLNDMLG